MALKDQILPYNRQVPRYTSYPTTPHFKLIEPDTDISLPQDIGTTSLYIHIPFCHQMCWYCGCHTKVTKKYDPIALYLQYLKKEIELKAQSFSEKVMITHLHFGGGSPGLIEPKDFSDLMNVLKQHFDFSPETEIAIELDPRLVTEAKIASYAKAGVTRASIGVQDFDEKVLKTVNRPQPFHLSYKAIELLKAYDITDINFDLLYGLPHQSLDTLKQTMEKVISLSPNRIAYFGYAHVPWMKKHMRLIPADALPDTNLRYDLFEAGKDMLLKAGYKPVGIDHFVKEDDSMYHALKTETLHRNFQGYTTDTATDMISFGVSAISHIGAYYVQNTTDMPVYKNRLDNNELPYQKYYQTSNEDRLRAQIIEQIMCYFEVDLANYDMDTSYERDVVLPVFEEHGFLTINDDHKIVITPQGRALTRLIASAFDAYLASRTDIVPRHASVI